MKTIVTPKAPVRYPYITTPDTRFNPDGQYRATLVLDPSEPGVTEFIEQIEKIAKNYFEDLAARDPKKKHLTKTYKLPFSADIDPETGEDSGKILCRVKSSYKPALFDAKRNPIVGPIAIGSGTIVRMAVVPRCYETLQGGLTLYMNQVQIIELKEPFGSPVAGFSDEEGGFTISESPFSPSAPASETQPSFSDLDDTIPMDDAPPKSHNYSEGVALVFANNPKLRESAELAGISDQEINALFEQKRGNEKLFIIALNQLIYRRSANGI